MDAGLYVVATPIGNLGDLSSRAVEVLRECDLIAAEDTRHSARLLAHFDIKTQAIAYHEHSASSEVARVERCLQEGGTVALISDAGTPLISDPGYRLVRFAQAHDCRVIPIPGACAAISALSVSGLPTDRFLFEGFLPAKAQARVNRLAELAATPVSLIFYEAPHRVADSLAAMAEVFGASREATLARELTKTFETIRRGTLAELAAFVAGDENQRKGEIVIVVAGKQGCDDGVTPELSSLLQTLVQELPAKRAAALVAQWSGERKKTLYDHLLSLKESG